MAIVGTALLGSAPAKASTVGLERTPGFSRPPVVFTAARGERNDLLAGITHDFQTSVWVATIADSGSFVTAGPGCVGLDAHTVRCSTTYQAALRIQLGDSNDRLRMVPPPGGVFDVVANGGPGDDLIDIRTSGKWGYAGVLDGGGGRDRIYGGSFGDFLTDGDRDGVRGAAGPGPDVLDGGSDVTGWVGSPSLTTDVVSYAQRKKPVWVDLARHIPAGERGEGDVVRHMEAVYGGSGADHLAGTSGPNVISGRGGRDVLTGRGGDDTFGGVSANGLSTVSPPLPTRTGSRGDVISCGDGNDEIYHPGPGDFIRPGCEELVVPRPVRRVGKVDWSVEAYPWGAPLEYLFTCSHEDDWDSPNWYGTTCSGNISLSQVRGHGRLLAGGKFVAQDPWNYRARLRITALGRQLAEAGRPMKMALGLSGRNLPNTHWIIRLDAYELTAARGAPAQPSSTAR